MLSYIVALVAAFLFLADPISRYLSPSGRVKHSPNLSPRPRLNESLLAIDGPNATAPECPPDTYVARVLSREPLVVYLENFLSDDERRHLLEISDPIFEPSRIGSHDQEQDISIRDSHVALIPRTDPVRCIERRALGFQGWRRDAWVERLRTQRYDAPTGHYSHHYDWSFNKGGWGRVSSFMAWVDHGDGSIQGGGTEFPLLDGHWEGDEWCRFVECPGDARDRDAGADAAAGSRGGTTFKVAPGNAVYWENFAPDGRGYEETWHAGLPVTRGTKVGLNIWTFGRIE